MLEPAGREGVSDGRSGLAYQPTFTADKVALCERTIRQHSTLQAQVYRARLALLQHDAPALDNGATGQRLGKHENWVRYIFGRSLVSWTGRG